VSCLSLYLCNIILKRSILVNAIHCQECKLKAISKQRSMALLAIKNIRQLLHRITSKQSTINCLFIKMFLFNPDNFLSNYWLSVWFVFKWPLNYLSMFPEYSNILSTLLWATKYNTSNIKKFKSVYRIEWTSYVFLIAKYLIR